MYRSIYVVYGLCKCTNNVGGSKSLPESYRFIHFGFAVSTLAVIVKVYN